METADETPSQPSWDPWNDPEQYVGEANNVATETADVTFAGMSQPPAPVNDTTTETIGTTSVAVNQLEENGRMETTEPLLSAELAESAPNFDSQFSNSYLEYLAPRDIGPASSLDSQDASKESESPPTPASVIDDFRFMDLCKLHSPELHLTEGDTLVFIDYPTAPKSGKKYVDCHGMGYSSQKFLVHSENLRKTNSSKFADMLNPTYQFRIQRRRKLANNLPQGVKYVLDLTPPSEGDDLVFQMTRLSLTPGIIKWWAAENLQDVESWLVTGHDDVCTCDRPTPIAQAIEYEEYLGRVHRNIRNKTEKPTILIPEPARETILRLKRSGAVEAYQTPSFRNIPDYCPIRHRNNTIRLLMMIEGKEVILDSANRVWSLVGMAKIFDCPSVVRDQVAQWIMYGSNTRFIEVLPEEALQIGFDLELDQVAQCAFRILVNEMAISEAATNGYSARTTVFGRRRGDLDDELSNIVQHAARALVERISKLQEDLCNPDFIINQLSGEWSVVKKMEEALAQEESPDCIAALNNIRNFLKAVSYTVTSALDAVPAEGTLVSKRLYTTMDDDRAKYVQPKDFEPLIDIMKGFNKTQRLMCPFIYQEFESRWTSDHFFYNKSGTIPRTAESSYKVPYTTLIGEFCRNITQVVITDLTKTSSPAWEVFFTFTPAEESPDNQPNVQFRYPAIDLDKLDKELKDILYPIVYSWVRHDIDPALNVTRHMMLTLTTNEMKYLPLWAGGFNDGTGGVFENSLPPAQLGPDGPGPAYHTGITVPSTPSSTTGSLLEAVIGMRINASTAVGSLDAQDSISTVYGRGHVIPDGVSVVTESFTADGSEYQEARFKIPSEHQVTGQAVDSMIEEFSDVDSSSTITDVDFGLSGSPSNGSVSGNNNNSDVEMGGNIAGTNERSDSDDGEDSEDSMVII